ncbi:hypothetical protein Y032_0482g2273 [Ancylostoma ceylanicum]|uniref:G-protein coupled receptors family 1 profile domain-containing protein n=1 Tax=Ancylostoma ceylanicum TaxID=53326 RepID=A0A016WV85_9BILA|nr:hypothetical protein Y032_0482g2273 [Ancylostoma ceylanicum]
MNMNVSNTFRCTEDDDQIMRAISTSPTLLSVLFIQATLSIIAQPLLVLAIRNIFRMSLIHRNTKIILIVYLTAIMVHSMSRILLHTTDLVIYLSPHESGCEIIPSVMRCFIMRVPLNYTIYLSCSSTFMIALERLISTYKAKIYESNKSVAFLLLALQARAF